MVSRFCQGWVVSHQINELTRRSAGGSQNYPQNLWINRRGVSGTIARLESGLKHEDRLRHRI
ncbi:protein of unknown function [Methylococcus capsulatus]|uniref:Uncharacterized protein n=1 Tax=Methylococcus capsulatus TaxID=414 RepID=A0AA35XYS0_METCP|nr:protein of unknown function [Methylococcus capsulatus]